MNTKLEQVNKAQQGSKKIIIKIIAGINAGKQYQLTKREFFIGRSPDNDIEIVNVRVSKRHAKLEVGKGYMLLSDLGSGNGTFVNGKSIEKVKIYAGDCISIAKICEMQLTGIPARPQIASVNKLMEDAKKLDKNRLQQVSSQPLKKKIPSRKKSKKSVLLFFLILLGLSYFLLDEFIPQESNERGTVPEHNKIDQISGVAPQKKFDIEEQLQFKKPHQGNIKMSSSHREAERLFKRAYQTYLSNRYLSSIRLFREVLLFNKNHKGARLYLERANAELRGLIDYNDKLGRELFDSLRYQQAIVHFRAVVNLLENNPSDPRYMDAKRYIKRAESILKRF